MHTDEKKDPLVGLGYEEKDINPKLVFRFSMYFFIFALASWGVGYAAMHFLGLFDTVANVDSLQSTKIPKDPNPVIQTNVTAKTEIRDIRRHENEMLATGGISEYSPAFKRIPIEQAIKLVADRKGKVDVADAGPSPDGPENQPPAGTLEPERKPASNAPTGTADTFPDVPETHTATKGEAH